MYWERRGKLFSNKLRVVSFAPCILTVAHPGPLQVTFLVPAYGVWTGNLLACLVVMVVNATPTFILYHRAVASYAQKKGYSLPGSDAADAKAALDEEQALLRNVR